MVARMPPLSSEQFFWDGECALLWVMIKKWKKNLAGYSDQMALSFMRTCVSKEWYHVVDTSNSLDECLENFALYSSNEELYLRKSMEAMRSHPKSRSYNIDKIMLNFFEKSIVRITQLNSAYILDFTTAQQLVNKLSDITLRSQFTNELIELRDSISDTHTVNKCLYYEANNPQVQNHH